VITPVCCISGLLQGSAEYVLSVAMSEPTPITG
jgi:hypothetical protein